MAKVLLYIVTRIRKSSVGNVKVSALLRIVLSRIFMELIMSRKVIMLALLMIGGVVSDESKTAVKVVLGGEWFTTTGEANGYLISDFKTKILEPILK